MLGQSTIVRNVRGKMVVKNRPARQLGKPGKDPNSKDDLRLRFQEAAQYARQQMTIPESKEAYGKVITEKKRTAYMVAMTDYLTAPRVKSIDVLGYRGAVGDSIRVKAVDDFLVAEVIVTITDANGNVIETGHAGPDTEKINQWLYKATVANPVLPGTKIDAVAYDRPGNTGTADVVL
jgi:hypothetical protein